MARAFEYYRNNEEAYMWIMTSDPVHDWDSYCDWCDEVENEDREDWWGDVDMAAEREMLAVDVARRYGREI